MPDDSFIKNAFPFPYLPLPSLGLPSLPGDTSPRQPSQPKIRRYDGKAPETPHELANLLRSLNDEARAAHLEAGHDDVRSAAGVLVRMARDAGAFDAPEYSGLRVKLHTMKSGSGSFWRWLCAWLDGEGRIGPRWDADDNLLVHAADALDQLSTAPDHAADDLGKADSVYDVGPGQAVRMRGANENASILVTPIEFRMLRLFHYTVEHSVLDLCNRSKNAIWGETYNAQNLKQKQKIHKALQRLNKKIESLRIEIVLSGDTVVRRQF